MPKINAKRITDSELQSFLWGSAVLLRGLIDAGDYKGYIFPLIFLTPKVKFIIAMEHLALILLDITTMEKFIAQEESLVHILLDL